MATTRTRKTDPAAALKKAVAEYERASVALDRARSARNEAMRTMKDGGATYAQVAEIAKLSPMAARSAIMGK